MTGELYDLFMGIIRGVIGEKRRATERERHERVLKPLTKSVFKYPLHTVSLPLFGAYLVLCGAEGAQHTRDSR